MNKRYLKELVEKERKAGVSADLIRGKLVAKGYPEEVIDDVLDLKVRDPRITKMKSLTVLVAVIAVIVVAFLVFSNINLGPIPAGPGTSFIQTKNDKKNVFDTNVPLTVPTEYLYDEFIPGISGCQDKKDAAFKQCIQDLALSSKKISLCTIVNDTDFQKKCNLEFLKINEKKLYCDVLLSTAFSKNTANQDVEGFLACSKDLVKSRSSIGGCGNNEICRAEFLGMAYEKYCLSNSTRFSPKSKCFAYFKRFSPPFVLPKDYDIVVLDKQDVAKIPAGCDLEGTSFNSNFGVDYDEFISDVLSKNCGKYTGILNQECMGLILDYNRSKASCKEEFLHLVSDYFVNIREKGWII